MFAHMYYQLCGRSLSRYLPKSFVISFSSNPTSTAAIMVPAPTLPRLLINIMQTAKDMY